MEQGIAERIRRLRLTKGLSQQNMAFELGLSPSAYSNIERGVADVNISRLQQIATVFGVDVVALLTDGNPIIETVDVYQSKFAQQLAQMMKELQRFQDQMDELKREIAELKKKK